MAVKLSKSVASTFEVTHSMVVERTGSKHQFISDWLDVARELYAQAIRASKDGGGNVLVSSTRSTATGVKLYINGKYAGRVNRTTGAASVVVWHDLINGRN